MLKRSAALVQGAPAEAYIVAAYIGMAYINMVYVVMARRLTAQRCADPRRLRRGTRPNIVHWFVYRHAPVGLFISKCFDVGVGLCIDMYVDMCADVCGDMCVATCVEMRLPAVHQHVYSRAYAKDGIRIHMQRVYCT